MFRFHARQAALPRLLFAGRPLDFRVHGRAVHCALLPRQGVPRRVAPAGQRRHAASTWARPTSTRTRSSTAPSASRTSSAASSPITRAARRGSRPSPTTRTSSPACWTAAGEIDLESWALPDDVSARSGQVRAAQGRSLPKLGTGSRGPATIMTSVLNPELYFYWTVDHPALLANDSATSWPKRWSPSTASCATSAAHDEAGWWITDDNSALFSPRLYATYCAPVLATVLDDLAPGDAWRYQHSDSAMGHLLDQQLALGIRDVNYGPDGGRRHHPRAVCRTPGYAGRCRPSCCATAARRRSKRG